MTTWHDPSDDSPSVILPQHQVRDYVSRQGAGGKPSVSERLMMIMTRDVVSHIAEKYSTREEEYPIPAFLGKHGLYSLTHGAGLSIVEGALSAPIAVDAFEVAIAMGCKMLFAFGLCGAVAEDVSVGDIVVPTEVVRKEGTSYHYTRDDGNAKPDDALFKALLEYLKTYESLKVHVGKAVSTDAVFRQTLQTERGWRADGILGVDMEMSALLTVALHYGIPAVCLLVASDKHDLDGRTSWRWGGEDLARARKTAIELYVDFATGYED